MAGRAPTRSVEKELWAAGHDVVVGIDEVGRGAWAGPLMVGAAILPKDSRVNGVRDSKLLTEAEREKLFDRIAERLQGLRSGAVEPTHAGGRHRLVGGRSRRERESGADGFRQHEHITRTRTALEEDTVGVHHSLHGQPEDRLGVADRVPARH